MNENFLKLLQNIELQRELNAFAKKILAEKKIDENSDDVAKFIIEVITYRANENKMRMVGLSDETMAKLVVQSVKYLKDWRAEKKQAEKKAEKPIAKPDTKSKPVPKAEPKKTMKDFDLDKIKAPKTVQKFVQTEIEFDVF